jgi:hypothetical protein
MLSGGEHEDTTSQSTHQALFGLAKNFPSMSRSNRAQISTNTSGTVQALFGLAKNSPSMSRSNSAQISTNTSGTVRPC